VGCAPELAVAGGRESEAAVAGGLDGGCAPGPASATATAHRRGQIASNGGRFTHRAVPSGAVVQDAWLRSSFAACLVASPKRRASANSSRIRRRFARVAWNAAI